MKTLSITRSSLLSGLLERVKLVVVQILYLKGNMIFLYVGYNIFYIYIYLEREKKKEEEEVYFFFFFGGKCQGL